MQSITAVLTVVIAMAGVYFVFALVVSWLQEQIAGFVKLRSKTLVLGVKQLATTDDRFAQQLIATVGEPFTLPGGFSFTRWLGSLRAPNVVTRLLRSVGSVFTPPGWRYASQFFNATIPKTGATSFPSYISAHDFVANLLTYVNRSWSDAAGTAAAQRVFDAFQSLPANVRATLPPGVASATDAQALVQVLGNDAAASAQALAVLAADARTAVAADLNDLATATFDIAKSRTVGQLQTVIGAMPMPLRDIMMARLRDASTKADNTYEHFVAGLEQWYDDYMDRVGGWYKRVATVVTVYLSLLVVVVLNVDSITLLQAFIHGPQLAQSLSIFSEAIVRANESPGGNGNSTNDGSGTTAGSRTAGTTSNGPSSSAAPQPTPTPLAIVTTIVCPPAPASPSPAASASPNPSPQPSGTSNPSSSQSAAPLCQTCPPGFIAKDGNTCTIDTAPLRALPLGYPDAAFHRTAFSLKDGAACITAQPSQRCIPWTGYAWATLLKLLGWLLTVIALSLGAPFWFDLLATFVSVRAAGDPPPKSADVRAKTAGSA